VASRNQVRGCHWRGSDGVPLRIAEHLYYTVVSVLIASAISVPPGLLVGHTARGGVVLVGLANAMRALPTLGLLTFLFLLLRSQRASALVVLAVPPVLAGSTDPAAPVTLEALRSGQAQVANLFTTSPDIAANRQVELADPKHMYPAQRILPLVRVGRQITRERVAPADLAKGLRLVSAEQC
jgi:hypothetical protein